MKELILIKNGEIALKGLNRTTFEDVLLKNIRRKLADLGKFRCYKAQSTMYIEPQEDGIDLDEAVDRVRKVFGIAALTRACIVEKDFEDIKAKTVEYLKETLSEASTFKVEAKRSDKTFPMNTPQICTELGGYLLEQFPGLTVDVHNPQVTVMVEIRDFAAYIHAGQIEGAGGMPVSTSGRAMLLVSGGIDSPVAGYMMAKRGMEVLAVHFVSPPYTSERAKLKVITLCEKMSAYCGRMQLFIVPFTKMQEAIRDNCPEELFTVIMRRMMMKIAEKLAQRSDCAALITGESLAQVASQTVQAIACTDVACQMPVLRPLIGMDKEEIIRIARKIDTFETSILPYEDCCTVFTPKHPRTRPKLAMVEEAEAAFDFAPMLEEAVEGAERLRIDPQ
ncbi:tRNA uracil 4-sulfurtransferase ThiI [Merdimmobilis hominis]|jgi:thiamine biosynthesis protein ThiI|uniref:tRNA uracil 4-sulfurtransferase ThiI n=1 Tax=Merdimmobilis hominis TaxID=2897707 RepID=UPI0008F8C0EC|nr:tRNA uracil 4-sulfurtransferase ThiI [Merdimmobilis hominis]PWL60928.1 MAG: tRNA 4-thiouridine(8) synthase ThiI [Oscillospiraceae bacterium]